MKVVTFLAALLMSLSMAASLFAAENKGQNDVDLIFQSSQTTAIAQPLELALLSEEEMAQTEGAWLNFAIGGTIGLGSYLYTTPRSNWSWGGAATNTAYGLVGGGAARVAGVRAWASWRSRGGGISFGRNFRVDAHRFTHQGRNVWRPHYHRRPGIKHHRPWQRGW